jgi:SAM-dependent methyltransferase
LGISDRHHFDWLTGALGRFEAEQGRLGTLGREPGPHAVWCLAGQREIPPIAFIRDSLGRARTEVIFFDKFPTEPGVRPLDVNALDDLPDAACDVLALFRASYFVSDPPRFLAEVRRVLRPGGLAVIDWLHGVSDAPVLDLRTDPGYGGGPTPFLTTYCDPQFPREFRREFERLLRHVNRPPAWTNLAQPGTPVQFRERVRRILQGGPRGSVTVEGYVEAAREALERAGKHLIGPELMEQHFKVLFRDARYFYRDVKKFNLFLLTVLSPVGK